MLKSDDPVVEVDLIDRLPTPWGLVRLGVAPDHENIKAVSRAFEKTASKPGFRFFGNVEVGRDVSHEELLELYGAVVYSVGAQTDRRLGIPGEDLPGSWPATAFVAWYNGHPDFQELEFDLSHERAVVVGNGNVAVDCVRMLALTAEELAPTDTTQEAIDAIVGAGLKEIVMVGRRGPVQAAFTPPELKELGELAGADVIVDPADLELDPASERELEADRERARRNVELLREYAERAPEGRPRRIVLRFLASPVEIVGDERVEGVRVVRNELVEDNGRIVARPTGEPQLIPAGIVLRSVGYKGVRAAGRPVRRVDGHDPERRRPRRGHRADLRRRLDQAWPERRHRHEQEGRDRDGRGAARGRAGGPPEPHKCGLHTNARGALGAPRRGARRAVRLAGDRRRRAERRRAARTAARQAAHVGKAPAYGA